ncbi:MAG: phosphodiester glycosidase family protein [Myxococcales bacterium]|nr:phosphodiester glycosidase family protein [Myxococcales bacterium]
MQRQASKSKSSRTFPWLVKLLIALGLVIAVLLVVAPSYVLKPLRWVEKKHFARLGDKGPLLLLQGGKWQKIAPALWKRRMSFRRKDHWSKIHLRLVRLDPQRYKIKLWYGKPQRIGWIMENTNALVAINGGLFDPERRPLGLFKQEGQVVNAHLHKRTIDGVFLIQKPQRLSIRPGKGFQHKDSYEAFQSSPLLVYQGKRRLLQKYSWKVDRRSALCLDKQGHLLLMATEGYLNGLSYYELGLLMSQPTARGGLGCHAGLNLDGGGSVQWAVRTKEKRWEGIRGMDATPLYLLITKASTRPNE